MGTESGFSSLPYTDLAGPKRDLRSKIAYFYRRTRCLPAPVVNFPESCMSIDEKLLALGISLPSVATPAAAYVMFAQSGNQVFLSGHIAKKDGKPWVGQLGRDLGTEEGKEAARAVAIDLLATLKAACGGDLGRVRSIVKVMSLVNSTPDYTEQHLVTNGASELLVEVFGDAGRHARSAFGVAQIPLGACVEIELIAEIA
jgi:enamine deaminase RidA (YjgF/YER057c/UK114 family)